MFPNLKAHKNDAWQVLYREPRSDIIIVVCQNKDSFAMNQDEVRTWLKMLGVSEELGAVDYVWNFYGAYLDLKKMTVTSLSLEQCRVLGGAMKEYVF